MGTRVIACQDKSDPVLRVHRLGSARPPPLNRRYISPIGNTPVEEPRLVDVVDPFGTVPVDRFSNPRDERLRPGSVRRTARTQQGNVVQVIPPRSFLHELRRPLETGDA